MSGPVAMTIMRIQIVLLILFARDFYGVGDHVIGAVMFAGAALLILHCSKVDSELYKLLTAQNRILGEVMAEQGEFVIRMASGQFYAGSIHQRIQTTTEIEEAKRYPTRWAALGDMNQGIQFAGSAIVPCPHTACSDGEEPAWKKDAPAGSETQDGGITWKKQ